MWLGIGCYSYIDRNHYAVVFTDYLTKWLEVARGIVTKHHAVLTMTKLFAQEIICWHRVSYQLLVGHGPAFLLIIQYNSTV